MNNDMRKTWLLRGFLFVVATLVLWSGVALVDAISLRLNKHFLGEAYNQAQVEGMVFVWVTSKIMWRWLSRRVWIGTTAVSSHNRGGAA